MPSGYAIRPCRRDECEAVLRVWQRADALPTVTDDLESVQRLVAEGPGALLVAEADGAIFGTIIAGWDGWRGAVYRLAVVPEQRRTGLGRALVLAALRWLRDRGARRCAAIVRIGEADALAFWQAMSDAGFVQQPENTRFVVNLD